MISFVVSILAFVAVLGLVVFVHEFGHYSVARWCKVKVEAFSMGFGPELIHWVNKSGERWRIAAWPLGGYVKFVGDDDVSSTPSANSTRSGVNKHTGLLQDQSVLVRMAVTVAGPVFNFLFAILVFSLFFATVGETYVKPVIVNVAPQSAAAEAGLKAGDQILAVDDVPTPAVEDVQRHIILAGGQHVVLSVARAGATIRIDATPKVVERETPFGDKERQGALGVELGGRAGDALVHQNFGPVEAVQKGVARTVDIIETQVEFIGALFRGGVSAGHLSGPLGIGQISGHVAESSAAAAGPNASILQIAESVATALVELAAILSIAVGFMNLLPLPVLDGGHLMFMLVEAVRGKPVAENIQIGFRKFGVLALMLLFVFVTVQDIDRIGLFRLFAPS